MCLQKGFSLRFECSSFSSLLRHELINKMAFYMLCSCYYHCFGWVRELFSWISIEFRSSLRHWGTRGRKSKATTAANSASKNNWQLTAYWWWHPTIGPFSTIIITAMSLQGLRQGSFPASITFSWRSQQSNLGPSSACKLKQMLH